MKRKLSERIVQLDADRTRISEERTALNEKKIRDEGMLERVDDENRYLQEHVLEEYNLTYSSALPFRIEGFEAYGAKTVISDLKKSISRLGDVNPLAVQALADAEQRHEECVTQRDDIQAAYDDIVKIIEELTAEMVDKFTTAFNQINENFHEVFVQLFGGGKGDLRLDTKETDDPLEAGIEISRSLPERSCRTLRCSAAVKKRLPLLQFCLQFLCSNRCRSACSTKSKRHSTTQTPTCLPSSSKSSRPKRSLSSSLTESLPCVTPTPYSVLRWKKRALRR